MRGRGFLKEEVDVDVSVSVSINRDLAHEMGESVQSLFLRSPTVFRLPRLRWTFYIGSGKEG